MKILVEGSTSTRMLATPKSSTFKSTLWSKFWSCIGIIFFLLGLASGTFTLYFLATSTAAQVTVAKVIDHQESSTKPGYSFVFEAENPNGVVLSYQPKMRVGRALHQEGQVIAGRIAPSSGRIMSEAILTSFKWYALVTFLFGLYAGRRVIFGPFAYWLGRLIGLVGSFFTKPEKTK
ncbi:hypothetical protein [Ruegeria meonggei]|uniref:hypothetical protein n=1 Tax=Ruegeria meonggei TaxID=1446476 RepID=UPI00366DF5F1